jgi:hypothetical protein
MERAGLLDAEGKALATLHGLRHTCGSIMLAQGSGPHRCVAPPRTCRSEVTAEVCSHLLDDAQLLDGLQLTRLTRWRPGTGGWYARILNKHGRQRVASVSWASRPSRPRTGHHERLPDHSPPPPCAHPRSHARSPLAQRRTRRTDRRASRRLQRRLLPGGPLDLPGRRRHPRSPRSGRRLPARPPRRPPLLQTRTGRTRAFPRSASAPSAGTPRPSRASCA